MATALLDSPPVLCATAPPFELSTSCADALVIPKLLVESATFADSSREVRDDLAAACHTLLVRQLIETAKLRQAHVPLDGELAPAAVCYHEFVQLCDSSTAHNTIRTLRECGVIRATARWVAGKVGTRYTLTESALASGFVCHIAESGWMRGKLLELRQRQFIRNPTTDQKQLCNWLLNLQIDPHEVLTAAHETPL